jgi:hypothetical protein
MCKHLVSADSLPVGGVHHTTKEFDAGSTVSIVYKIFKEFATMKKNYELLPYLDLLDLMTLFSVSEGTIRRWLAEARAGRSRFPLPVDMGRNGKGKLFWTRESIIAFQNSDKAKVPLSNTDSATAASAKRHAAAVQSLIEAGVKLNVVEK